MRTVRFCKVNLKTVVGIEKENEGLRLLRQLFFSLPPTGATSFPSLVGIAVLRGEATLVAAAPNAGAV